MDVEQKSQPGKYDLSEVPESMRDDIKNFIERQVQERVLHEMEYLRAEANQAFEMSMMSQKPVVKRRAPQHPYNYYGGGFGYYGQPYGQTVIFPDGE